MKICFISLLSGLLLFSSCGSSYEKSPEDWSADVCICLHENGVGSPKVDELLEELNGYYSDDDSEMHDKATTLIGQDCPEALFH